MSLTTAIEEAVADLIQHLPDDCGGELTLRITVPSRTVEVTGNYDDETGFTSTHSVNGDDSDYIEGDGDDESDLPAMGRKDCEPHLGCASTRDLLTELSARMQDTQNSNKGRELGSLCREALEHLAPGVLEYKTIWS